MAVMTEPELTLSNGQPGWVTTELPPRYAELAGQIAALQSEARTYEGVAAVLWQTGGLLTLATRDLFAALQLDTFLMETGANYDLQVQLDGGRRLLVLTAGGSETLDRKADVISRVFATIQQDAGEHDRVVVVSNAYCGMPLAQRKDEPIATDALKLIRGLGANVIASSTLFGIWRYSFKDAAGARKSLTNLHTQEGGIFR